MKNKLDQIKKDYLQIEPSLSFLTNGWAELENKITLRRHWRPFGIINRRFQLALAALFILLITVGFSSLFKVAHASLPGENLYPVKRFSENIVTATTGDNQIKIDHRAEEICHMANENLEEQETFAKIVREYQKEVEEVKEENTKLKNKLAEHQEEFKKLIKEDSSLEEHLIEVVEEEENDEEEES